MKIVGRVEAINIEHDIINGVEYGMVGDGVTDNAAILQGIIDSLATGYGASIFVPAGEYYCSDTITILDRPIHLYGESGSNSSVNCTKFTFPAAKVGFSITRDNGNEKGLYERFVVQALAKDAGDVAAAITAKQYHGIHWNSVTQFRDITVTGFSGHGFHSNAAVIDTPSTNSSLSYLESCESSGNSGSGFYLISDDANQMTLINCDARDNDGWGFDDRSFLGNQFYGCHGNQNDLGHYHTTNANNRSGFFGCYAESGSPASVFTGSSVILGGLHATTVDATGCYLTGSAFYADAFLFEQDTGNPFVIRSGASVNAANFFRLEGSLADNGHFPGIYMVGGTLHPDSYPEIIISNGGINLDLYSANGSFSGGGGGTLEYSHIGINAGSSAGSSFIDFYTASAEKMRLTGGGSLLIGVTSLVGSEKLNVNGTALFGKSSTTLGTIGLYGNTSGLITIQPQAAAGTYNFNLPTTAGTSGYLLTSGGGGSTAMTWTDPATIVGKERTLFDHFADAGNVGSGEDDLYSDTLAAGQLSTNGDKIILKYSGITNKNTGTSANIRVYFGGTQLYTTGDTPMVEIDYWDYEVTIIRVSSSVIRYSVLLTFTLGPLATISTGEVTGLTLANTQVVKVTGQVTGGTPANNEIVAQLGYVKFIPAA